MGTSVLQHIEANLRPSSIKKFQKSIVDWYSYNGRRFPWRETKDPYRVMIAEFLLQKTDAAKVEKVYPTFLKRWPSLESLAKARVDSIASVVQPLGLQYRASRIKATAKTILKEFNGRIPDEESELMKLPGIGKYMASAIQCFAFNKPTAILDTNVIRILERAFEIKSDNKRPREDRRLWEKAQILVPSTNAKKYNWGLLDYGAISCKSRKPLCSNCSLSLMCNFSKTSVTTS